METANNIRITRAAAADRPRLAALLTGAKLPVEDLPASLDHFILALQGDQVVGSAGLEILGSCALLRSLAVDAGLRGSGLGKKLYTAIMEEAEKQGIQSVYLITNTADRFFERMGFKAADRETVPGEIRATSQFSSICPSSAIVMYKNSTG